MDLSHHIFRSMHRPELRSAHNSMLWGKAQTWYNIILTLEGLLSVALGAHPTVLVSSALMVLKTFLASAAFKLNITFIRYVTNTNLYFRCDSFDHYDTNRKP